MWTENIPQNFVCLINLLSTPFLLSSYPDSPGSVLLIGNPSLHFSVSVEAYQLTHEESKHSVYYRNICWTSHTIKLVRWTVSGGPEIEPRWTYVKDQKSKCSRGWKWQRERVTKQSYRTKSWWLATCLKPPLLCLKAPVFHSSHLTNVDFLHKSIHVFNQHIMINS